MLQIFINEFTALGFYGFLRPSILSQVILRSEEIISILNIQYG